MRRLSELTGWPVLGVLPWVEALDPSVGPGLSVGLNIDVEDSLGLPRVGAVVGRSAEAVADVLRVAVIRFPFLSIGTDVDALAVEPGVEVRMVDSVSGLKDVDLVVLPGTRATVRDLTRLRERALDDALRRRAAAGRPVLGVCGGYQMLARSIEDDVESRAAHVSGRRVVRVDPAAPARRPG